MKRIALILLLSVIAVSCGKGSGQAQKVDSLPSIYPDYTGVTVPAGIAPLNFNMADESATGIDVVVKGAAGAQIHVRGREVADFPAGKWRKLLGQNAGSAVTVEVKARFADGWRAFLPFEIYVSPDEIDYGITYRLIGPGFESFSRIGIYERALSGYKEKAIIDGAQTDACLNCHTYRQCDPDYMTFHVRGAGGGTFINTPGEMQVYNTKTDSTISGGVYPYWHPSGKYIAYSNNRSLQGFFERADKVLEVYDGASDVVVYDLERNELITAPWLRKDGVLENMPVFSADGESLYFTQATSQPIPEGLTQVRYNLCRVDFDPETGSFGTQIDTVVFAEAEGKSVSFPKPSYDGRFLMYQLADYGCFGAWHTESDLWLLDLETGRTRALSEVNSDDTESTHSWSSNSRWFVFGSRRDDGLHTRAYICHIDDNGECGKPFMLPQENPRQYYDAKMKSYNIPEFISRPVPFSGNKAVRLLKSDDRIQFGFRPLSVDNFVN